MNWFLWILVGILTITLVFGWGFVLWVLAEVLSRFFNIIGFFWSLIGSFVRVKWLTGRKKINSYFYDLALSKDQHSNVVLRDFFNKIMLKKLCIPFGDPDLPLSWYFAVNKLIHDEAPVDCGVGRFGLFWAKFLDLFEKSKGGHLHTTIHSQMMKEYEVMKKNGYIVEPNIENYKAKIVEDFMSKL